MGNSRWHKLSPRRVWRTLDIDRHTALMMLKGGLPPTMLIAMFQSWSVANILQNYGYFSVIISIISQCLQPRAIFMKVMLFNVIATCSSASLCCLGIFCAVRAREHTTAPGTSPNGYNSSAAAVAAIWFIFDIWLGNTIRTYRPFELQTPIICFSIFVAVGMTRAAIIPTLSAGLSFVRQFLLASLLGFAISTAVALFIFPLTSRGKVFHELKAYPNAVKSILEAEISYVKSSESNGPWRLTRLATRQRSRLQHRRSGFSEAEKNQRQGAEFGQDVHAVALKLAVEDLTSIHSNVHRELYYAKQEFVWGKLSPEDLDTFFGLLRSVILPLSGIGMLPGVFRRLTKTVSGMEGGHGQDGRESTSTRVTDDPLHEDADSENHFIQPLCERLESAAALVNLGLQHTFISLELAKAKHFENHPKGRRKARFVPNDEEATADERIPGGSNFIRYFEEQRLEFFERRKNLPRTWASLNAFSPADSTSEHIDDERDERRVRKEFFVVIFIGHLQDILLEATSDLVKFADSKISDGTMKNRRLIFPKMEHLKQWLFSGGPDEEDENDTRPVPREKTGTGFLPSGNDPLKSRFSDPEHLPPVNNWQRCGNNLRQVSKVISSEQSVFGFRVAIASFSAAILAYLSSTQDFFNHNRINWVVIVIVIGMTPTSGRSVFGMIGRIIGTTVSTALAFAVWYIAVEKTAGVIVLLYVANCIQNYFYVKFPRFIPACIIALITFNLIIANQLQVRKLGLEVSTSKGLNNFPIYLFAPYRLAAVCAGCAISFIWTIFPSPTTAGSQMRKTLGRSLFILANFYSCMHTSIRIWIDQEQGDINDPLSPGRLLDRARNKLFAEEIALLSSLRMNGQFTKYEPTVGGHFPKKTYESIASEIHIILISMDLMARSTRNLDRMSGNTRPGSTVSSESSQSSQRTNGESPTLHEKSSNTPELGSPESSRRRQSIGESATYERPEDRLESIPSETSFQMRQRRGRGSRSDQKWIQNLTEAAREPSFHAHIITSVLYHLSSAVSSGFSLPPYLAPPHPFPLARNLRQMNEDLLNIRNVEDPSFSAFVAVEVLSSVVSSNLKRLVSDVKVLVGELNFDIYVRQHRDRMHEEQQAQQRSGVGRAPSS